MTTGIEWRLERDLAIEERERVIATFRRRVIPALQAIATARLAESGADSPSFLGRMSVWISRRMDVTWARTPGSFRTTSEGMAIHSLELPRPFEIPFTAGVQRRQCIGFADYAAFSALAIIASETHALMLLSADSDRGRTYVKDLLARVTGAGGPRFQGMGRFFSALADGEDNDAAAELIGPAP